MYKNKEDGKLVEDNEIKAVTSPFAIREGEIKVFDGKDGYVSMNQIVQRINLGHINDLHFKVLSLVTSLNLLHLDNCFNC